MLDLAWGNLTAAASMLGWCFPAVPPLRWTAARSTNSAPVPSFTFHPGLPTTIVGSAAMRRMCLSISWAPRITPSTTGVEPVLPTAESRVSVVENGSFTP